MCVCKVIYCIHIVCVYVMYFVSCVCKMLYCMYLVYAYVIYLYVSVKKKFNAMSCTAVVSGLLGSLMCLEL